MSKPEQQQQQKRGMRAINHPQTSQESNQSTQSRHYPVSSRAYNKKDYDYLSSFPRVTRSTALKTSIRHSNVGEQSDGDSDLFMSTSSVDYANSLSSASSTSSSAQSCAKYIATSTDMESDHQRQSHLHHDRPYRNHRHQRDHHQQPRKHPDADDQHLQLSETSTLSPGNLSKERDLQTVSEEKSGSESNSEVKDNKLDISDPAESGFVKVKEAPVRLRPRVRSRHIDTPAGLPKFGSWDTKNPSSGEAYTLIFRRLRDEKKSGAVPICGSPPTHPKVEEADELLRLESKAKEPLCPKSRVRKDFSRRKAKPTSHQEATGQYRMRWIFCCKTSVLDD